MSAPPVDVVLAGLVDASIDAARVFHLAACCCRCYLLAVSLDRRALDHEADAQVLRRLSQGATAVRRQHESARRSLQAMGTPRTVAPMRSA